MIIRDKKGRIMKGSVPTNGYQKGHIPSTKGKPRSPETIQKMKERCGHPISEETKEKIRITMKRNGTKCKENNPMWKGGKYRNQQGYICVSLGNGDYALEHRMIIEAELKRKLRVDEHVHHINGIKTDNRRENLILVINTEHFGEVICPHCQKKILLK